MFVAGTMPSTRILPAIKCSTKWVSRSRLKIGLLQFINLIMVPPNLRLKFRGKLQISLGLLIKRLPNEVTNYQATKKGMNLNPLPYNLTSNDQHL